MTQYNDKNEPQDKFIEIGIIRHDRTDEHTFIGKTYTLSGDEKFSWSINYLRADQDSSIIIYLPYSKFAGTVHWKDYLSQQKRRRKTYLVHERRVI